MKTLLRLLVLFVFVPAGLVGSLYALERHGFFNLDQIDIILLKNTDQPRFMQPLVAGLDQDFEKLRGQSMWRLDLEKISQEVTGMSWVREMQVRRSWPDRLEVRILPKEVKFLYVGKNGLLFPVLEDATLMNEVPADSRPDVVLLRGDDFLKNKFLLMQAIHSLDEIPEDGSFSRKTISEIRYDEKEGFWATLMKNAIRVKLGDDHFSVKADRISQVLDYLEAHQFDARVIDANLTKKVLVRLRKGP